jgi:uncharacterized protein (DUF885 family)
VSRSVGTSDDSGLRRLCESYCDLVWHLDPVEGASAGVQAHAGRLGSFTADRVLQHLAALRAVLSAAEALELDTLDDEIDRTALVDQVRVAEHRWRVERPHERDPSLWVDQVLEGLQRPLLDRSGGTWDGDAAIVDRVGAVPGVLRDAEASLTGCPRVLVEAALASVRHGPELVAELEAAIAGTVRDRDALATRAGAARDAMRAFEAHLEGMLRAPGPDEPWGVGEAALRFRLRHEHALVLSPDELLRHAGTLLRDTERELATVAATLGARRWEDVVDRAADERLAGTELLAAYNDALERARVHVQTQQLVSLPDGTLDVVATPGYARAQIPVAAYLPPGPLSGDRTGRLFVTASDGGSALGQPRVEIAATVVHEGIPGHHLQFLVAQQQPRAVRRLLYTPVTVEGWALYTEGLMDETGFYRDAEERFFRLLALRRRALRIPLDVGIQTGALSYEAAVGFAAEHMFVSRAHAEAEVRRSYAWPGGQLAYAAGYGAMQELRADIAHRWETLGAFHDAVLAYGGLPVSLIRWGLERG